MKLKVSALQKTISRECEDRPPVGSKDLQKTCDKGLFPKVTKNSWNSVRKQAIWLKICQAS